MSGPGSLKKRLKRVARIALLIAVALVLLEAFFVQHGKVRLSSMEPSLGDGDWVLFEKLVVSRGGPRRFDIVVFKAPTDPDKVFIKRVAGLPNEIVEAKGGRLFVDGEEVALGDAVDWGETDFGPVTVSPAHYFVVGDNLAESLDSREWGSVPRDYILSLIHI